MKAFLLDLLGAQGVLSEPDDLGPYSEDYTEIPGTMPGLVARVTTAEQVRAIVGEAHRQTVPLTPRVAGTNVGGLALPSQGGVVLDLTEMNAIVEINNDDMYAVLEPGVTQQQLKDELARRELPLTTGYSLGPPHSSVAVNALLAGLTNRSLKYGDQSAWISGLEVVLADGSLMRTGSWALADQPFGRVPFPDLTGLFVGWQATTGIVTKVAFQLWPQHPLTRRLFVLSYSLPATYHMMRNLCRREVCEDIGGLSWPAGKMMLGVSRPAPTPQPGEPVFLLYVDLAAETEAEMSAKSDLLDALLAQIDGEGTLFERPMTLDTLLDLNPQLSVFAEFPTELEFLTNHGGGGLSWVGTYGPLSRFEPAALEGMKLMQLHGFPPLIVSRPMRGGHFGVLRFITTFDKQNPAEVSAVQDLNQELLQVVTRHGFVMYKTPAWAWQEYESRIDSAMLRLMKQIKKLMDPRGILNPGKLGL
jgi:glycolate oxidase